MIIKVGKVKVLQTIFREDIIDLVESGIVASVVTSGFAYLAAKGVNKSTIKKAIKKASE